jgi:Holliday junction resolvasome RuvABC endonuclease subunit
MKIAAFDLSIAEPGWAMYDANQPEPMMSGFLTTSASEGFWARADQVVGLVGAVLGGFNPVFSDLVVLEGLSYGSAGNASLDLAQLGGIVRMQLHRRGLRWVEVAPGTLKVYATGSGRSKKPAMLKAAEQWLGFEGGNNNEVDAIWLREMALDQVFGNSRVPPEHRRALKSVKWPTT